MARVEAVREHLASRELEGRLVEDPSRDALGKPVAAVVEAYRRA